MKRKGGMMIMVDKPVFLSALWIAIMLTYFLGDELRIYRGDIAPGKMGNVQFTQGMWLGIAILMLVPIVMVLHSLMLPQPVNRWANIIVAVFFFVFNLIGLPTYP